MRLFKWTPDFNPKIESPIAPVWIRLPELPVHLSQKKSLFGIASLVGLPLKLDEATADGFRPSMARICVELDLLKTRPESIWIGTEGRYFSQPVVYERCPKYCSQCLHLGHGVKECREGLGQTNVQQEATDLRTIIDKRKAESAPSFTATGTKNCERQPQ
ncbi:UNVERIFIED_CONTAM: hypothetical protein Slati_4113000 [Sesamum latifolium]|uniref:DUF4283 domain-containing protein n=1 Tax=Sesamum latifolium TaxID=2727402 RepID=A0AAW2TB29_9LAMI